MNETDTLPEDGRSTAEDLPGTTPAAAPGPPLQVSPDQLAAAGGYIARSWSDCGYRIESITSPTHLVSVFRVAAADGARFAIAADRYGNCTDLPDDLTAWPAAIAAMHKAAAAP